ncbi:hypothetical protein AUR64_01740 [Haloprofundus marisrubri]|uniref:N-acetyltransferase domain-containing protein n=1 Tax=Haloprofundus marisrubri TaxID=1514971 RepID=A0A0W1R435_9EURY|nr:hypothetical protein [Haloprofundus marisrubri]KTG07979.1 hypothetical protein AUR64_01740 [Haloprofundus marisrubri]
MEIRDAVEADAEALAGIADAPTDVMRNLVHDRTVHVATEANTVSGPNEDADGEETAETDRPDDTDEPIVGFVSYDAKERTVHVTQFGGQAEAVERLLEEPLRFARTEGMETELLVGADDDSLRGAAERVGFEEQGTGPMFDGQRTVRYRLRP